MRKELVHIIIDYLTDEICNYISNKGLSFHWSYKNGQFSITLVLVKTRFTIIAKNRTKKGIGMQIMPDEYGIKIICYNYIDNFEQVAHILGEFEKELLCFEQTFPSSARRKFIRDNYALLTSSTPNISTSRQHELSNKYLHDHNLIDEFGAKEIALDHLLGKEYYFKMQKDLTGIPHKNM